MSWAAIVSGKARHSSPTAPTPLVAASATTTVTINPHIPIPSHSPLPASTLTNPSLPPSASPPPNSHSPTDSASSTSQSPPPSSTHSQPPKSPSTSNNTSSDDGNSNPSSPNSNHILSQPQFHHRNRSHNKQKNQNKRQQQQQQQQQQHHHHQPQSPQSNRPNNQTSKQSPPKQSQMYNQSMWNDPRILAIYRLWTHHISSFMAQPVPFFHVFVINPQFRQSVFDAGLTFHPDTDPTNPVLINLNSSRFGMAERISALSPPARFDTRSSSNNPPPPPTPPPTTPTSHHMSPLSEPSQPPQQLQQPPSPAFLSPNLTNFFDNIKSATSPRPNLDHVLHFDPVNNPPLPFDPYDPILLADVNAAFDDSLAQRFADSTRLDVSDSESERLSEGGDPNFPNGVKTQTPLALETPRRVPVTPRRRNGRSRVVSRVLDIRIPSSPVCKSQSDKAKVEFIEQIGEIFPKITPPKDYADVRTNLLAGLRKIISAEWKGADIDVYGSAGNGLGLRSADVDMSLYMPDEVAAAYGREEGKPDSPKLILARLAAIMEENSMVILSKFLGARVPVIKMQDPVSKLQVDVCVNNTLAVRNTQLLKAYVDLDERFRYVCVLVKLWAKRRDLNDTYHGTLSSYAYTLLVIHYLQVAQPPVLPCLQRMVNGELVSSDEELPTEMTDNGNHKLYNTYFDRTVTPETFKSANTQPVHELLMGFFKYYAYTFKYRTDLASIRLGVKTPRSARGWDESAVYAEWEAKQAQYKTQLEAARAALDARRKADIIEEKKPREKGAEGSETPGTGSSAKRERIQFPRRPRLASKHLFCIEDPFDIDHDLSRGMEKAAVTVIRQEMMRAYELIAETGDYELVCEEYR